jgi:multiple sugar transport system permease protein
MMAMATIMTIPMIILYFVAQRYFIEGITVGGVKG